MPDQLLWRWNFDPALITLLIGSAAVWILVAKPLATERRLFLGAMAVLLMLFVSPFCALTSALFSARALHHLVLTTLAAPLLAMAWPKWLRTPRGNAVLWTGLHAVTFWLWHAPVIYGWALSNNGAYWLMQASLLFTATAMWQQIRRSSPPIGLAVLLATMVQMGLLGALLTFTQAPLYPPHFVTTLPWGLTPLEDQTLGGLIMWAPGAGLYLIAALTLLARWFSREGRSAQLA